MSQDNVHTRSSIGRNRRRSIQHCVDTGHGYPSICLQYVNMYVIVFYIYIYIRFRIFTCMFQDSHFEITGVPY